MPRYAPLWRIGVIAVALCAAGCASTRGRPDALALADAKPGLNQYVLRAVELIQRERGGKGYGSAAFTQDLQFGDQGILRATGPPLTMCVAAQLEVLVEALNLYARERNDFRAFTFLPKTQWERIRPTDLKGKIWMVENAKSNGAASALQQFGMGQERPFESAQPGDFLNLNRTNRSGHGVVFLGYLDRTGADVPAYNDSVAGFKYFSSQGKVDNGGFGYRYAFFDGVCPTLPAGQRRDCGVIRSRSQRMLNVGSAWLPTAWSRELGDAANAFSEARPRPEGTFDPGYFTGQTTDD